MVWLMTLWQKCQIKGWVVSFERFVVPNGVHRNSYTGAKLNVSMRHIIISGHDHVKFVYFIYFNGII